MHISDEHLIAYLLGDAPAELASEIESNLAADEELVSRLSDLRLLLGHMDSLQGVHEPPSDLIANTMARIEAEDRDTHPEELPLESLSPKVQLSPSLSNQGSSRSVSFYDSAILVLCLIVLCCFILPTVVKVRFESRKSLCANNLREVGTGLFSYAMGDTNGRFPVVGTDPRTGFAGVYSVHLKSSGMPLQYSQLQCPSLNNTGYDKPRMLVDSIPTLTQLTRIAFSEIAVWQEVLGGHYAYNLGVMENEQVVAPHYEGRSYFAILSDAPVRRDTGEAFVSHEGRGVNFLFEDGSVQFIHLKSSFPQAVDHPFLNMGGQRSVGLNENDAVLAPSPVSPIRIVGR